MTRQEELLIIFTRNPELGKCKTRLAATIGDRAALEVYKFLLGHTVGITRGLSAAKKVYYSEAIKQSDIWDRDNYDKGMQRGHDLGERMMNAFKEGFEAGYKRIIIIGSDMFDLSKDDIENAFKILKQNDFVIGPAKDGGYYLLGMKHIKKAIFLNKSWGEDTVLSATLGNLEQEEVGLLEMRNDVDVYEDIKDNEAFFPFIKHLKDDKETT